MSKINFRSLATAVCILASIPSLAWPQACRSTEESQADSALRYQARLRVIALSCIGAASGQSLYTDYQSFVARNQDLLQEYQTRLLHYYRAHAKGDPAARLRTRDTELNNEESLDAARNGISSFCRAHVPDLQRAATASPVDVRREIEALDSAQPAAKRKCS